MSTATETRRPGAPGSGPLRRPGPDLAARQDHRRSRLWRYRRVLFLAGLLVSTALTGVAYLVTRVPLPPEVVPAQTTFLTDANGFRLAELHGRENRVPVHLRQVPVVLRRAVVASEDRNFFRHGGVDPVGVARATWADVRGQHLQGGSTITQQYVKNTYVGRERSLVRKVREAVLAVKLERKYPKAEILERYLNTIYLGRGAYGVQAAADAYFRKDVSQLDLSEAAYLAALIRSPEANGGPGVEEARRARVLGAMEHAKLVAADERAAAEREPIDVMAVERRPTTVQQAGSGTEFFVEYVRQHLLRRYPEDLILRGGLRVQTTLDLKLQAAAYDTVYNEVLSQRDDPDAALVTLDSEGRVVAMVGGRDWGRSKVNLAVGDEGGGRGRQGGSAFKPFVLAAAIKDGYSVESSFPGPAKIVIPKADNGHDWTVSNFEDESFDRLNLVDATAQSVNTVYAQLVVALGPQKAVEMAHELGIGAHLDAVPSIALGTQDVSVLDMADAYLTFARGGLQVAPEVVLKVTTADGTVIEENHPKATRALERSQADLVTHVLRQVVDSGTGTAAAFGKPAAGKTGTTEDYGDAWFVGYTPKLTTAVWMGYAEGQSRAMTNVHGRKVNGGSFPSVVFRQFMTRATKGLPASAFPPPPAFTGRILGVRLTEGQVVSGVATTVVPTATTVPRTPRSTSPARIQPEPTVAAPADSVPAQPPATPPPRRTTTTVGGDGSDPGGR